MGVKDQITQKLRDGLQPSWLEVIDESEQHRGHGGWRDGGETHFRVKVASPAFAGKSRVEMHRTINALLADELGAGVHALAIEAKSA